MNITRRDIQTIKDSSGKHCDFVLNLECNFGPELVLFFLYLIASMLIIIFLFLGNQGRDPRSNCSGRYNKYGVF